jgi:tRNA C32,U32 (ribose-2'-O)-methylase TrmJ
MQLEDRTQDALEILSHASTETSARAKFLLTYLAIERMVMRSDRSDAAKKLIREFDVLIENSELESKEAKSLKGSISSMSRVISQRLIFANQSY